MTLKTPDAEVGDSTDNRFWVSGRTEAEALANAAQRFNVPEDMISLKQDEDVLDTWFSSALFPFSVFGWPDQVPLLLRYLRAYCLLWLIHEYLLFLDHSMIVK